MPDPNSPSADDAETREDESARLPDQLEELREEASVITTITVEDELIAVPPEITTLSTPPESGVYVRPAITGGAAGERWVVQTVDAESDTIRDELPVGDEATAVSEAVSKAEHDDLPVITETVENRSHTD